MKLADKKQINIERANLFAGIVFCANTYTGARFERPFKIDQTHILESCVDFVFSYFSMLRLEEVKAAFELALAGKLKDCDITTYYGKFTVQTLSIVLNAYSVLRKQINAEFSRIESELAKQKTEQEIADRNAKTIQDVKTAYENLVSEFHLIGTIDESKIKPFWGKILVQEGIVNFTAEQKEDIYKEAKQIITNEVKASLGSNEDLMIRKQLLNLLSDIQNGNQNEDFISKSKAKYSHLIVVKSILNS